MRHQPLDMRHYRFERRCEGFYPEPEESSGWLWWLTGAACGLLLLAAVIL